MNIKYNVPELPLPYDFETKAVLKQASSAHRRLAELKGVALTIPNENILIILKGIEETSNETIGLVRQISSLMAEYKIILRPIFGKQYKHELLNNLFFHPYTKIEYMERDMMVQRKTATKYLDQIVDAGLLKKVKLGRSNYYVNTKLVELFSNQRIGDDELTASIESMLE